MSRLLISYRYSLFALFLVFNAIICSVAVWNYTIAQALLLDAQVDVYISVIAGFAVLFIIPITFVDVFRKNALTGRVWFELAWVGAFWVLELCGASAFTALLPDTMCTASAIDLQHDSCTSSRVLQAFTWLCATMLLIYLIVLFVCVILHYDDDQRVWQSGVRFYPWFGARSALGSTPPSPTKAASTWQRKSLKLVAPQPKRPARPADLDIESGILETKGGPSLPSMQQAYRVAVSAPRPIASTSTSMYPAPVAAAMGPVARTLPSMGVAAPPLGNWPRPIQMQRQPQQPPRRPRVPAPVVSVPSAIPEISSPLTAPALTMSVSSDAALTPLSSRLSGRRGSGSPTRRSPPPPLDLTKISAYNAIEERRRQLR